METTLSTIGTEASCGTLQLKTIPKSGRKKSLRPKRKSKKLFPPIVSLEELTADPNEDVIRCLKEEIAQLTCELEQLRQIGAQKDEENERLKRKVDELNDVISSAHIELVGHGSDLFSKKIIELSKKNRQLCSEMEHYKTRCSCLEKEIAKMNEAHENKPLEEVQEPDNPSELEALRGQLCSTKTKMFGIMNENTNLKNELKLAHKCLAQELGVPSVNLQSLTANSSTWRGRAQQIMTLQAKLSELSKKVEGNESDEVKQQNHLEFIRRCEVEGLQKECATLKETIGKLEFKLSATKARNKNLNDEATCFKLKTGEMVERCKELDDYIQALNVSIA